MGKEIEFENTFAPACKNRTLTVGQIIAGAQCNVLSIKDLPKEVRDAVHGELQERQAKANTTLRFSDRNEKWMLYLLDTGLGVRDLARSPEPARP